MADEGGETAGRSMDLSEMMRMFMEDRRQREAEMQAQVELLRSLVEETRGPRQAEVRALATASKENVKLPKLTEEDDIESYLTTFERMMAGYEIGQERWAYKLAPQLTGRAQQAFAAMDPARASDYKEVKAAILRRYDISEETYRRRFRAVVRKDGESYRELATRVQDLFEKWTRKCTTVGELRELLMLEQWLNALPHDARIWVIERETKTLAEAGKLADRYEQARRQLSPGASKGELGQSGEVNTKVEVKKEDSRPPQEVRRCHNCGMAGHFARDCRRALGSIAQGSTGSRVMLHFVFQLRRALVGHILV